MPKPRKNDGSPSAQIEWEKNKIGSILVLSFLAFITIGITLFLINNLYELMFILILAILFALIFNRIFSPKKEKNLKGLFAWFVLFYILFYIMLGIPQLIIIVF